MFVDDAELLALDALSCERYYASDFALSEGMAYVADLIEWKREQAVDRVAQLARHLRWIDALSLSRVYPVAGAQADVMASPDIAVSGRSPPE